MEHIEKKTILIFGAKGQLGLSLQTRASAVNKDQYRLVFLDSSEVDVTDKQAVENCFVHYKPKYCINAAAYTAVDHAEKEKEKAFAVNEKGVRNIAESCQVYHTTCIHISTDFVFQGNVLKPLVEDDVIAPINVYGASKWAGEKALMKACEHYIILRTSWLYSEFGSNFLKTMNRLATHKKQTKVIYNQIGTPTYAGDLANVIYQIIQHNNFPTGIYHFSNEGVASWYDFAYEVFKFHQAEKHLIPILAQDYSTPAKRPLFTVLNKDKIKKHIAPISHWREGVHKTLVSIQQQTG